MQRPLSSRYLETQDLRKIGLNVGENVFVDETVIMVNLKEIKIGTNVRIDSYVVITPGLIDIGNFVHIGSSVHLSAGFGIQIGECSNIGQGVKIYSASDDYKGVTVPGPWLANASRARESSELAAGVQLEGFNIIGPNTVILPGVRLGKGVSVGANSLVKNSADPWKIIAGTPSRVVGHRDSTVLGLYEEAKRNFSTSGSWQAK